MEIAMNLIAMNGLLNLFSVGFGIAMYVMLSLGLYTIAQRRGLHNPWLAWIPFGNMWILGSISDQYQYSVKGKKTNRRKILLGLEIAATVAGMIVAIVLASMIVKAVLMPANNYVYYADPYSYGTTGDFESLLASLLLILPTFALFGVVVGALTIVYTVFMFMSYYDLYVSCCPENATLYLVLGIFFNFLSNIFTFVCRHKDDGMRVQAPPQTNWEYQPVQEPTPEEEHEM